MRWHDPYLSLMQGVLVVMAADSTELRQACGQR